MNSRSVMRWMVGIAAVGLMLYMCALPGDLPASVDGGDGLAGTYTVNGVNPNGSDFGGTAVFSPTDTANVYDLQLIITGSIQQGVATVDGDRITTTWRTVSSADDGTVTGTGDYTIGGDGVVTGTWQVDGSSSTAAGGAAGTIEMFPDP